MNPRSILSNFWGSLHPCHPPNKGSSPVFIGILTPLHPQNKKIPWHT